MLVVYGKGKVGNGVAHLLTVLGKEFVLMDDADLDEVVLRDADQIIVSPGIKRISHVLWEKYSDKLISELNFLAGILEGLHLDLTTIGITATNGKSTTTWVLYKALEALMPSKRVWITGNFDEPVSEVIAQILEGNLQDQEHVLVVECSSFMLFGIKDWIFDAGILLNVARDHLDWHKDWDEYRSSKLAVLEYARFGATSSELFALLDEATQEHTVTFDGNFDLSTTKFIGQHNQQNFSAIEKIVFHLVPGLHQEEFVHVLSGITPLAHRLQLIREVEGVKIYDDGICTSSHSLNAALLSFDQKLVWVGGGYDKGDDYDWLADAFTQKVELAVVMGQITGKIQQLCEKAGVACLSVASLHEGIQTAFVEAKKMGNLAVLYSPGAASFDLFKNVYHRVEEFEKEVGKL